MGSCGIQTRGQGRLLEGSHVWAAAQRVSRKTEPEHRRGTEKEVWSWKRWEARARRSHRSSGSLAGAGEGWGGRPVLASLFPQLYRQKHRGPNQSRDRSTPSQLPSSVLPTAAWSSRNPRSFPRTFWSLGNGPLSWPAHTSLPLQTSPALNNSDPSVEKVIPFLSPFQVSLHQ